MALVQPFIQPGVKLLVLSSNASTPREVAGLLCERGYGRSRLTVLSHLGGEKERIHAASADAYQAGDEVADLNTLAIECVADPDAALIPRTPGLADELYEHDGQLTKREVRAITLAALGPVPGQLLWDIGAGCGSIGIEWMRTHPECRTIAIEPDPRPPGADRGEQRCARHPGIDVVKGRAVGALEGLVAPDAIFVGGGITEPGLLDHCWAALKPGGRLVANVVSVEGETTLDGWQRSLGGSLTRIAHRPVRAVGAFPRLASADAGHPARCDQTEGRTRSMKGTLYGLGIGPGDPELITLKALRILERTSVLAYPAPEEGESLVRSIVADIWMDIMRRSVSGCRWWRPVSPHRRSTIGPQSSSACTSDAGRDVAVLCEGDPFFYGSFMYMFGRMAARHAVEVVPGVSSLMACAATLGAPLAARNDILTVLPATLSSELLEQRIRDVDSVAIIKVGRHLRRVRAVIEAMGLTANARYVEHATMASEKILPLADVAEGTAPYFSMILLHAPRQRMECVTPQSSWFGSSGAVNGMSDAVVIVEPIERGSEWNV